VPGGASGDAARPNAGDRGGGVTAARGSVNDGGAGDTLAQRGGGGRIAISATLARTAAEGALLPDGHQPIDTVVIEVADDGPGMVPGVAEKIFNPFFTTKAQGSGLGLAIVRKIVDAHEGRIDMSTADGRGTRFRVTLPVEPHKHGSHH
jgi:signal transduction histidine kinase